MTKKSSRGGDWEADSTWGSQVAQAAGVPSMSQLVGLVPVVSSPGTAIPVGACLVSEIDIQLDFQGGSVNGLYQVGIGLYIAEYDAASTSFANQYPLNPPDACRDNWLELAVMNIITEGAVTFLNFISTRMAHNIRRKVNLRIAQGQALRLCVHTGPANPGSLLYGLSYRSKVRRVM
jgi:hypothetical protein